MRVTKRNRGSNRSQAVGLVIANGVITLDPGKIVALPEAAWALRCDRRLALSDTLFAEDDVGDPAKSRMF